MDPVTTETTAATGSSKIIMGIVAVLLIGGIAWGVAARKGSDTSDSSDDSENAGGDSQFSGNVFDLAGRGGDRVCTWEVEADNYTGEGTIYTSDGKFSSTVSGSASGVAYTAHMISDGTYVYSWTDMVPFGSKISVAEAQTTAANARAEVEAQGGTPDVATGDVLADFEYDCDSWDADASVFVVPTNITFSEFNY